MRQILVLICCIPLLAFLACQGGKKQGDESTEIETPQGKINLADLEIDSAIVNKLDKVYFLNLNVYHQDKILKGYLEPNDTTQVIAGFNFGDTIPVLEDKKDGWLTVYVNLRQRKYDSSYNMAYIKKSDLGEIKNLVLEQDDFRVAADGEEGIYLVSADTLNIELISKNDFKKAFQDVVSPLEDAKQGVKQEQGVLSIITGNGMINLKDKNPITDRTLADDQVLLYSYEGFNKKLSAHMVRQEAWESGKYTFYSQATGEVIASSTAYPVFSSDNKLLVDIAFNGYEGGGTEFTLQRKNNDGKYEPVLFYNFQKWTPLRASSNNKTDYFFGEDNAIYVRTIFMEGAGTELENITNLVQYIKITIGGLE